MSDGEVFYRASSQLPWSSPSLLEVCLDGNSSMKISPIHEAYDWRQCPKNLHPRKQTRNLKMPPAGKGETFTNPQPLHSFWLDLQRDELVFTRSSVQINPIWLRFFDQKPSWCFQKDLLCSPQKLGKWSNLTCAYFCSNGLAKKNTNYNWLLSQEFVDFVSTHNCQVHYIKHSCSFPIVSLTANSVHWTVLYFDGGASWNIRNPCKSSPILNPKNVIINGEHRCCVLTMYLPMGSMWLVLGGGFKYFFVHPYLQRWSNLTNILIDKNSTGIGRADLRRHLAQKQVSLGDTDALRVARRAYNAVSIETLHLAFELWLCWCKTEVQFRFQVWPR